MQQFCKQSRAAGCTATAATRRPPPSWWRRRQLAATWRQETCQASCCSPQVCRPPSSRIQLEGNKMVWDAGSEATANISHESLLSLLSRKPNHTVWWMKPKDQSCSRTKRFSFSVSMVKTSVLLPIKGKRNKKIKSVSLTKYWDWLDAKTLTCHLN